MSIKVGRFIQTVKALIRLLLQEQADQGLHCLSFQLHILHTLLGRHNTFHNATLYTPC